MSSRPIATWAMECVPGKKYSYPLDTIADLKITNASLGQDISDEQSRSTVILSIHESPGETDEDDEDDALQNFPPTKVVLTTLCPRQVRNDLFD